MKEVIKLIVDFINAIHDIVLMTSEELGFRVTDKELHLWIIGVLGMVLFFLVHALFKVISQWTITSISFIYTFTVLVVIVFAIEIEQKVTGRGQMEFTDAVIGLYGFVVFFTIYSVGRAIIKLLFSLLIKTKREENEEREEKKRSRYRGYYH
ncbi:MAG: hypothetical protein K6T72_00150 [Anoxybacillus sp.]|nr:hypothetical protein [Anoxybacillus sp.]MCL6584927.1 hypothetical protein [Anoxybacillus sp.]